MEKMGARSVAELVRMVITVIPQGVARGTSADKPAQG
jgi:hypothetical protein